MIFHNVTLFSFTSGNANRAKKKADGYIDVNIDAASVDLTGIREE